MAKQSKMELPIPNVLGIPSVLVAIVFGFVKFLEGSVMGGIISGLMSAMGIVFLYFKIRGQVLDNQKKSLRYGSLKGT